MRYWSKWWRNVRQVMFSISSQVRAIFTPPQYIYVSRGETRFKLYITFGPVAIESKSTTNILAFHFPAVCHTTWLISDTYPIWRLIFNLDLLSNTEHRSIRLLNKSNVTMAPNSLLDINGPGETQDYKNSTGWARGRLSRVSRLDPSRARRLDDEGILVTCVECKW